MAIRPSKADDVGDRSTGPPKKCLTSNTVLSSIYPRYCTDQYRKKEGVPVMTDVQATTAQPGGDRLIWIFNMLMDVKATAEETGGALSVIDSRLTPAANPPLHVHHDADEAFFVLEGEVEYFLADR